MKNGTMFSGLDSYKSQEYLDAIVEHENFVGKYTLQSRNLSDYEKSLIPVLPEWYIIPQEVVDICKHAQATTGKSTQMRNFLLRGPAGVYQALIGVENAAATSQDCMSIVLDRVTETVRALSKREEAAKSSGQTYIYIETDFIKAMKNGYVIEIQEPFTIVQPGVLVGLNSLLEQTGAITLPTGEVIHRHPDAVVVVTTNITYLPRERLCLHRRWEAISLR